VRTAIKFYFLSSANHVFFPGYLALIRVNGIVCESITHGSLSKENSGRLGHVSVALYMCFGVCKGCWLLEIIGALSAWSGRSYRCSISYPIFSSPTPVLVRSWLRVFGIPFSRVPALSIIHPQAPRILFTSSTYSGKVLAAVLDKSGEISYFCVLSCTKMVAHLTQVFTEYEERVLVLGTGFFFYSCWGQVLVLPC